MPRTKGSKNKKKPATMDYAAQIADVKAKKKTEEEVLADMQASLDALKEKEESIKRTMREQNAVVKKLGKQLAKLEEKKAEADKAAEAETKKAQAQDAINKLIADGMSVDEILEKLK